MKLSGFNRQFKNLKNVGVQYRFQGNTQWTDLFTWWVNPTDTIGRDTVSNALLPEKGDLRYAAKMKSNLSFPEGDYQFRAFTTTPYGTENVQVYSDIVTVTKDMTRPRNLYTPAPANGILGYGDQLAIECPPTAFWATATSWPSSSTRTSCRAMSTRTTSSSPPS